MAVDYAALKAGGFMRQKQKDTFSLRLRVVGGTVTTEQLTAIKAVADKYGQGYIHLTSRQGIEIPFIKLQDIDEVKAALAEGNVSPGVCGPRVRTVTACQGGRCCPSGCIDALEIAEALDARYFGRQLPHKFKFGVTGCQNNCLKAEENDFGVKGGLIPEWHKDSCIFCGVCEKACRTEAITISDGNITIEPTTAAGVSNPVLPRLGRAEAALSYPSAAPSATISRWVPSCCLSLRTRPPCSGWRMRPSISSQRTPLPVSGSPRLWIEWAGTN